MKFSKVTGPLSRILSFPLHRLFRLTPSPPHPFPASPLPRPLIQCLHVMKRKGREILQDASLQVYRGDFVFLVGPSGAGKTTFLELLMGLGPIDEGNLLVEGQSLTHMPGKSLPGFRRRLGVVFQDLKLLRRGSVFDNVALPLRVAGCERLVMMKKVCRVVCAVGLGHRMEAACRELSQGELQRVAVARALVHAPVVVVADEPTAHLDRDSAREILELLSGVNMSGTTVLVATHDETLPDLIPGCRVVALRAGRFTERARPESVGVGGRSW